MCHAFRLTGALAAFGVYGGYAAAPAAEHG